ncbi:hypothetical protein NDU88_005780 [Pleurodeles waltl]|uniref:Reverse transcriptase n=1 Tax=Pleurodeles waltl TaxID=8319 RepID=A0AAV7PNP6_PLEWA|nr:hypothetical protein NDU88_005780 [Pleurodeles waltl]
MGMTLQPSLILRKKLTINHAPIEITKHFNYLGVRFSKNLSWDCQVRKAAIALKQAAAAILRFEHKPGGRSISIILEIYVWKAVAAALYEQNSGYIHTNTRVLQVTENNFLGTLLGLGQGTPLKALFAELNLISISELAALRPILYWVRLVHNPRAVVYLETLEEVIVYNGSRGHSWGAYFKKTLENLWLEDLRVDPGRVSKDTVGLVKDRYREFNRMRVCRKLRPDSITHYYFNNVHDIVTQVYLDMLYPELKQTLYIKYRLCVLPEQEATWSTLAGWWQVWSSMTVLLGRRTMWLILPWPLRNLKRQGASGYYLFLSLMEQIAPKLHLHFV